MERELSRIFEDLTASDPLFSELKKRVLLNAMWKEIMGEEIAFHTHVCEGKNKTLDVWVEDPVLGTELRFRTEEIIEEMSQNGFFFKKVRVKKLKS